jgi:hypothetical protein
MTGFAQSAVPQRTNSSGKSERQAVQAAETGGPELGSFVFMVLEDLYF